jgi:hypothetical protein
MREKESHRHEDLELSEHPSLWALAVFVLFGRVQFPAFPAAQFLGLFD